MYSSICIFKMNTMHAMRTYMPPHIYFHIKIIYIIVIYCPQIILNSISNTNYISDIYTWEHRYSHKDSYTFSNTYISNSIQIYIYISCYIFLYLYLFISISVHAYVQVLLNPGVLWNSM